MSKDKELSHAEIWDDSALINSWNDALEEYNHYHSLHARGEKVEEVLQSLDELEAHENGTADVMTGDDEAMIDQRESTDGAQQNAAQNETLSGTHAAETTTQHTAQSSDGRTGGIPSLVAMPQALMGAGQDEALRNLMKSWYYAGYYTGLYEGQQKAQQPEIVPQSAPNPPHPVNEKAS